MNITETTPTLDRAFVRFMVSQTKARERPWLLSAPAMTWAFMAFGIILRLRQYLFNRSLWNDETLLAMNILRLSPAQLLKPLQDYQTAPVGFLWLEKLFVHYLGTGEMALRLVPLLCGIGSIFLFVAVARRFLPENAVVLAVGLFAVCDPLVYYASEVKQYSSDVAVVLCLFLLLEPLFEANLRTIRVVLATLTGGVAIWCSFPATFVLAGIGLAAFWVAARRRNRTSMLLLCVPAISWIASLLVSYLVSLRDSTIVHKGLMDYWRDAFAPFPPSSISDVLWYKHTCFDMFYVPGGLTFTGISALAAALGLNELRKQDLGKFLSLLLPILAALLASMLHRYPFQGRLLLFLAPSLMLLVAGGLANIKAVSAKVPALAALLIGFLFLDPMLTAVKHLSKPEGVEEVRSAVDYIEQHRAPGDILYCYYSAQLPLQYYRERGRIGPMEQVAGVESREDWQPYNEDLDKLRGQKRVWILFSHIWRNSGVDEQAFFLAHLNRMGNKIASLDVTGASAYLYDLRDGAMRTTGTTNR